MDERASQAPSPDEIRAQADRMIASDELSRSPQLGAFLRFVVDAVLQGKSDRIKAYTIGVDVLRRDAKFDPQLDPIVRVEATRLRRTIDRYYAGPGKADVVRIDLPRGSYIPTFSRRRIASLAPPRPASSPWLDRLPAIRPLLVGIRAALLVIAIGSAVWHRFEVPPNSPAKEQTAASRPAAVPGLSGNGLPVLLMPPFQVSGPPQPRSISAQSLHDTLTGAFTRFDLINVLLEPERQTGAMPYRRPRPLAGNYRFAGSVEYSDDGAARLLFRVIDVADDGVIWSRVFDTGARRRRPVMPPKKGLSANCRHLAAAFWRHLCPPARQGA